MINDIVFPANFITGNNFSWPDVRFLYEKGWVSFQDVLNYAAERLKVTSDKKIEDEIINLLINPQEEAQPILNKIISYFTYKEYLSIDRILVGIIGFLSGQALSLEKILDIIDSIYCDLNHISELSMFIRYMPEKGEFKGSLKSLPELKKRISYYLDIKEEQSKTNIPFNEIDWI